MEKNILCSPYSFRSHYIYFARLSKIQTRLKVYCVWNSRIIIGSLVKLFTQFFLQFSAFCDLALWIEYDEIKSLHYWAKARWHDFFFVFSKRTQKRAVWLTEITRECETIIFIESINTQRKLHIPIHEQMTHHIPDLLMNQSRIWITLTNLSLSVLCSMCRRFVNERMSSEWMNRLNRKRFAIQSRFTHELLFRVISC